MVSSSGLSYTWLFASTPLLLCWQRPSGVGRLHDGSDLQRTHRSQSATDERPSLPLLSLHHLLHSGCVLPAASLSQPDGDVSGSRNDEAVHGACVYQHRQRTVMTVSRALLLLCCTHALLY